MRTRKVVKILSQLPPEKRQDFHLFLASPYHNSSEVLPALARQIEEQLIEKPEAEVSPEMIYAQLPSRSAFRANYFDKLLAQLLTLVNEFLVIEHLKGDKPLQQESLLAAYCEAQLDEWIPGQYKNASPLKNPELGQDADGLHHRLKMEWHYGTFLARRPRGTIGEQFLSIDQRLNEYYYARKMELATAIININRGFNTAHEVSHLSEVRAAMDTEKEGLPGFIRCQAAAYDLLMNSNPQTFAALIQELETWERELGEDTARVLYLVALNDCTFRANKGEVAAMQEIADLYDRLLEKEMLTFEGKLPPDLFKNIFTIKFRLGEVSQAEQFITDWQDRLTHNHEGYIGPYAHALVAFYRGEFSQCLQELEEILRDYKADVYLGMDARVWKLKALFERNTADDSYYLDAQINAFRVFVIRDKKLSEPERNHFFNFAKQMRRLVNVREAPVGERPERSISFLAELKELKPVSNQFWFEEKVKEILA